MQMGAVTCLNVVLHILFNSTAINNLTLNLMSVDKSKIFKDNGPKHNYDHIMYAGV